MEAMYLVIVLFTWIGFSCMRGVEEAYTAVLKMGAKADYAVIKGKDFHPLWVWQRVFLLVLGVVFTISLYPLWKGLFMGLMMGVVMALVYSFFHDGMFYVWRNRIASMLGREKAYPKGWVASPDGNAKNDFALWQRAIMLISGLAIFVIINTPYISALKYRNVVFAAIGVVGIGPVVSIIHNKKDGNSDKE